MDITILGSGAWEGIPAPFCMCNACASASPKDKRTRPQFLVESEEGKFLIELSPDIRMQTAVFKLPVIKDALISHWHFDHMYGLLELHAWSEFIAKLNIHCSEKTKEWLDRNFAHIPKNIFVQEPFKTFKLHGIDITPIPVYHMHSQDDKLAEGKLRNTFGYVLEHKGKTFVYLADHYKLSEKSIKIVKGADIAVVDGTYLFEEVFPDKSEQNALKSDPDHMHGNHIITFAKSLEAKLTVFHSISHLSEKRHDDLQKQLPKNMLLAYDGMKLNL
jgi:phosphoribosyl 1,2-cyclic phosphate phosphodiesterase